MKQQNAKKRRPGATGAKALIAAASVTATIAGWAMLPANDPPAVSSADSSPAALITEAGATTPASDTSSQWLWTTALPTAVPTTLADDPTTRATTDDAVAQVPTVSEPVAVATE